MDETCSRASKRFAKHVIGKTAKKVSKELLSRFTEEVLEMISAIAWVRTFDYLVAFTETLRRHKEDFASLLQRMADLCKALFADVGGDLQSHRTNQWLFLK